MERLSVKERLSANERLSAGERLSMEESLGIAASLSSGTTSAYDRFTSVCLSIDTSSTRPSAYCDVSG